MNANCMVSKKTLEYTAEPPQDAKKETGRKPKGISLEKKFKQWKEYGEQFTEEEKRSYINGYNHAIQDILRLARGGAKARLVRNQKMRETMRAVVIASVQCGIDAAVDDIDGCQYHCECYDPDVGGCAALSGYPLVASSYCSVEEGIPSFDETFNEIRSAWLSGNNGMEA